MQICLNCLNKYDTGVSVCPHCGFGSWKYKSHEFCLEFGIKLNNRYKLGTVIGAGGFGITYRAVDLQTGNPVAIKEFYPSGLVSRGNDHTSVKLSVIGKEQMFAKGINSFLEEAKGLIKFKGAKNIVQVYDFFEQNGTAYIVMEYLRGKSLSQHTADCGGKLRYDMAVKYMLEVLDALEIVHRTGMVHRDISPDNIFIQNDGTIKLIDFGAARESYGNEDKTLSIVLKPNYAPPEQFKKKSRQGPWTDIYALGATIYKVLTGSMPPESVGRYMEDDLMRPSAVNNTVPPYFDGIIYKAMALSIENRYQSAKQLMLDIKSNMNPGSVQQYNNRGNVNGSNTPLYNNQRAGYQMPAANATNNGVYRGSVQEPVSKSGSGGIFMLIALIAVGVLLVAVIIIALVKNSDSGKKGGRTNTTNQASTNEPYTDETSTDELSSDEASTDDSEYVSYGMYVYDFPPVIYVDEALFGITAEDMFNLSTVKYTKSKDGTFYTAVSANDIYTNLELYVDENNNVEAFAAYGLKYTQEDLDKSYEILNELLGEATEYEDFYLWENDKMCTGLIYGDSGIYTMYMTPEYWEKLGGSDLQQ